MSKFEAAVLHDYFVDRVVMVEDLGRLAETIKEKASEGGGGIHGILQKEIKGGNAVNVAYALARLGTRTFLVTHTDRAHERLLRTTFRGLRVELSVKRRDAGLTVALEGKTEKGRINVMLGHSGGAGDFPPSLLSRRDWDSIASSRIVCVLNWAANDHGTELLEALRSQLGSEHQVFLDPSDVIDRLKRYEKLLRLIRAKHLVDWISFNEYEAKATARLLGIRGEDLGELCVKVARELNLRVDIHTQLAAYTSTGSELTLSKTERVIPKRLTGAGDVWDAAAIHFYLEGKNESDRLALANAAARYYVSSGEPEAPTEEDLLAS